MTYNTFEDLEVWQNARILCKDIYVVTREDKFQKDYRFVSQITASAGSIMDNIAEGFERDGNKEFLQFLSIAKGSCGELRSQIHRAYDFGYVDEQSYIALLESVKKLSGGIYFFMQFLKNAEFKGIKYKS